MKLGQQLKIKQNQSLIMTPQLQQAIKLLQLTNIELSDFIEKAQLENPFLKENNQTITKKIVGKFLIQTFDTAHYRNVKFCLLRQILSCILGSRQFQQPK